MEPEDQLDIEEAARAIAHEADPDWPEWFTFEDGDCYIDRVRLEAQIRAAMYTVVHATCSRIEAEAGA